MVPFCLFVSAACVWAGEATDRFSFRDLVAETVGLMAPRRAGVYTPPTDVELLAFRHLFETVATGDLQLAAELARPLNYEIRRATETESGGEYALIMERQPWRRRFGLYAVAMSDDAADLVIEVPHPKFDVHSGLIGACLMGGKELKPFAFLMSTIHRYDSRDADGHWVADATHYPRSVFQVAHEALTTAGRPRLALQVHGYQYRPASHGKYAARPVEVVLSQGGRGGPEVLDPLPGSFSARIADALGECGISTATADSHGLWTALCARQNPQGHFTNGAAGPGPGWFVHLECERGIREAAARGHMARLKQFRRKLAGILRAERQG